MKGIAIYFLFLGLASAPPPPTGTGAGKTSNVNNSVIFHHRTVPRVANERYCYIFFIFRVIWGEGVKGGPLGGTKKKRKTNLFFLITQLWVVTERSRRWQMKGIAIYFLYTKFPLICPSVTFFLRGNNSALGGHRALPKVANERYCYIFLIFGVGIASTGTGNRHWCRQKFEFFNNSALGG